MRKLLVATHNAGKVREYRHLLADLPLEVTWLDAEGIAFDVEETGASFAENAVQKATTYAAATGLWTWADDSGLEVDALGGAPGIRSSRYAGPEASDADRNHKLLRELADVPWEQRTARFRCVVAIATPEGDVRTASGCCEGIIAYEPRGSHGFGFDPVFFMPQFGCTMAELSPEVKNRVSHRAQAAQAARKLLRELLEAIGQDAGEAS
ncbi:MAG: XTP/dITP diphosphatase [Anaerolineae bacterium]|nr:XTP/dITP diphosphatase [Anaerolineae bacterium]